jgi:hypothetical protein
VSAVNLFNEIFWDDRRPLPFLAEKYARLLSALTADSGAILAVEPGIPRSGEFIAALREALIALPRLPLSPCPHAAACPMSRGKWCHFAFDTRSAPEELHRLSAAAGIPKERATVSFLLAGAPASAPSPAPASTPVEALRIISDPFPVPFGSGPRFGRYACSGRGLVLVWGERGALDRLESGALLSAPPPARLERDPKSGALLWPTH